MPDMTQLPAGATLLPDAGSALPSGATLLPDATSSVADIAHTGNAIMRSLATGIPVIGGAMNAADAGLDAAASYALNPLFPKDQQLQGSLGDRYRQALATQNGMDRQFHEAHPVADTAAHITGGVLGGLAGARFLAPTMAGLGISTAPGLGGVALRSGVAATGGSGVGAADAAVRGENVGRSAVVGALLGGAGSTIGDAVGAVLRPVLAGPVQRAQAIFKQKADADALTQDSASSALERLGPAAFLGDLGPNMHQAMRAVASTPGPAQRRIAEALISRADSAGERVTNTVDGALGPRTNVLETADDIAAARARQAAPLYEAAYRAEVPVTPELQAVLSRPAVERATNAAQKLAADAGEVFDVDRPSVMGLDYTKRALDDAISSALRSGSNNEARILIENRNAIVGHLDAHVPEYAAARRVFSDHSKIADALANGQELFRSTQSPDAVSRALSGMSDAERSAYQEGARQQIAQVMGTARNDANAARAMMDKGYNREKLDLLIGPEPAASLNNAINAERTFAATRVAARENSSTDRNLLGQQGIPGVEVPKFRLMSALSGAVNMATRPLFAARNARTRDALADALLSRDTSLLVPNEAINHALSNPVAAALIGANQNGPR